MSEAKAFLVINATPNPENMSLLPEYLSGMMPVFGKFQGEMLSKYKVSEQLVGNGQTKMIAIISFANTQNAKAVIESDEYKALAELRAKVFTNLDIMLSEGM